MRPRLHARSLDIHSSADGEIDVFDLARQKKTNKELPGLRTRSVAFLETPDKRQAPRRGLHVTPGLSCLARMNVPCLRNRQVSSSRNINAQNEKDREREVRISRVYAGERNNDQGTFENASIDSVERTGRYG